MNGINSIDVIKLILQKEQSIDALQLIEFNSYKLIQERIDVQDELSDSFNKALDFREKYKLPFWDGFNLSLFDHPLSDFGFLEQVLFHNSSSKTLIINRENFISNVNGDFSDYTALSSKILNNEVSTHIPLLDFHAPIGINNQKLCENIIKYLGLTGYILDSGKSYHFIGDTLVTEINLKKMLYTALLLAPIIDRAWVAHQLIQNFCCLRVSKKYDRLPYVVTKIE